MVKIYPSNKYVENWQTCLEHIALYKQRTILFQKYNFLFSVDLRMAISEKKKKNL